MKTLTKLLTEITQITTNIETNYLELYRSLDENPLTIPATDHLHIDKQIMENYLESLKQLLKHHLETHNIKK